MGMFDYKNYTPEESYELIMTAKMLAIMPVSRHTYIARIFDGVLKGLSQEAFDSDLYQNTIRPFLLEVTLTDVALSTSGTTPIKIPSEVVSGLIDLAQELYNSGVIEAPGGIAGAALGVLKFFGLDNAIIDDLQQKLINNPGTDLYLDLKNQTILFSDDSIDIPSESGLLNMLSGMLGDLLDVGNLQNSGVSTTLGQLPEGYSFLTHEDLGLDPAKFPYNARGYFTLESPFWGSKWIDDGSLEGPDIAFAAKRDANGNVTDLIVSLSINNSVHDEDDFLMYQFQERMLAVHEEILSAVRDFAIANNLDPSNITFTGFSHGAGITNIIAQNADSFLDGFFEQSNFIGFAAPYVSPSGRAISIGSENDAVFRVAGDYDTLEETLRVGLNDPDFVFPSIEEILAATENGKAWDLFTKFLLPNLSKINFYDPNTNTGTDNMLLYTSSSIGDDELAVTNLYDAMFLYPNTHFLHGISNIEERIYTSTWYDLTYEDSFVIVADLNVEDRKNIWVEKRSNIYSDNLGMTTFFVGSANGEKMRGDYGNDYIDGAGGDDTFQLSGGHDQIDGGEGTDTLIIEGSIEGLKVYDLGDGKLAFYVEGVGLTIVQNVEKFLIDGREYSIDQSYLEDDGWNIFGWFDADISFGQAELGTDGNDELGGDVVFAGAGNDFLLGNNDDNLLVGGEGADRLNGSGGNDALYGGEGNDILRGGAGNDILNGGVGTDMFVFNEVNKGEIDIIEDFQKDLEVDIIILSMFDNYDDLRENMYQDGENVEIDLGRGHTIVIQDYDLENISAMNFVFS